MKKVLLAAAALAVIGSAPAFAADMPLKAPAAVITQTWTGFYIGGELGYRWDRDNWLTTGLGDPPIPGAPFAPGPTAATRFSPNAFRAGVYAGYNWQVSPMWVVGLEGDYTFGSKTAAVAGIPGTIGSATFPAVIGTGDAASIRDKWDAGIRGRLGALVSPNTLLFATTGISWLGQDASATCGPVGFPVSWCGAAGNIGTTSMVSHTATGWELGAGVEWMVAMNWLLRAEYRHVWYKSWNAVFFPGFGAGDAVNVSFKSQTDTILLGLAYKLN